MLDRTYFGFLVGMFAVTAAGTAVLSEYFRKPPDVTAHLYADVDGDTDLEVRSVVGRVPRHCAPPEHPAENLSCYLSDQGYYPDKGEWLMHARIECWGAGSAHWMELSARRQEELCNFQILHNMFHLEPVFTRVGGPPQASTKTADECRRWPPGDPDCARSSP